MSAIYLDVIFMRAQLSRLLVEYPDIAEDAELLADTLEGQTDFNEVVTRLVRMEREAAAFSEAVKSQEEELCSRRARFVRKQQATRQFIRSLLESAGMSKLMLPEATLSITKGRLRPVITDEALLPPQYLKVKTSPDLTAIGAALVNGVQIAGAHISNGAPSLSIRVK